MGGLGDWLGGGAKAPKLPHEMRELAGQNKAYADDFRRLWDEARMSALGDADPIRAAYKMAEGDLGVAHAQAQDASSSHLRAWRRALGMPASAVEGVGDDDTSMVARVLREMDEAGGEGQQEFWAKRASDAVLEAEAPALEAMARASGRYGYGGATSAANNPMLAAILQARAASAGNNAAWQVFDEGRNRRLNFLPYLEQQRERGMQLAAQPAGYAEMMAQILGKRATAKSNLIQHTLPIATTGGKFNQQAYNQYDNNWGRDFAIKQHNAARRNNMISRGIQLAGAIATGGASLMGGAAAAGSLSAGAGAGSTLGMKLGSSLVAPGGVGAGAMAGAGNWLGTLGRGLTALNSYGGNLPSGADAHDSTKALMQHFFPRKQ